MNTLNTFLRNLPELVVDNILFVRNAEHSTYRIQKGVYSFHKIGYNEYEVKSITSSDRRHHTEWTSSEGAGDIFIQSLDISVTGVRITLGDDVPDQ